MSFLLQEIAREITTNFVSGLKNGHQTGPEGVKGNTLSRILLKEIAREVVAQLKEEPAEGLSNPGVIQVNGTTPKKHQNKSEEKLRRILDNHRGDSKEKNEGIKREDLDEGDLKAIEKLEKKGVQVTYPNLKYKKPKYQNVSELLKYVESEGGAGEGVKLVIMNFND